MHRKKVASRKGGAAMGVLPALPLPPSMPGDAPSKRPDDSCSEASSTSSPSSSTSGQQQPPSPQQQQQQQQQQQPPPPQQEEEEQQQQQQQQQQPGTAMPQAPVTWMVNGAPANGGFTPGAAGMSPMIAAPGGSPATAYFVFGTAPGQQVTSAAPQAAAYWSYPPVKQEGGVGAAGGQNIYAMWQQQQQPVPMQMQMHMQQSQPAPIVQQAAKLEPGATTESSQQPPPQHQQLQLFQLQMQQQQQEHFLQQQQFMQLQQLQQQSGGSSGGGAGSAAGEPTPPPESEEGASSNKQVQVTQGATFQHFPPAGLTPTMVMTNQGPQMVYTQMSALGGLQQYFSAQPAQPQPQQQHQQQQQQQQQQQHQQPQQQQQQHPYVTYYMMPAGGAGTPSPAAGATAIPAGPGGARPGSAAACAAALNGGVLKREAVPPAPREPAPPTGAQGGGSSSANATYTMYGGSQPQPPTTFPAQPARAPMTRSERMQAVRRKRPMNSFMLFGQRHRNTIQRMFKTKDNKAISTILGTTWKRLPDEARDLYTTMAQNLSERHRQRKKLTAQMIRRGLEPPEDDEDRRTAGLSGPQASALGADVSPRELDTVCRVALQVAEDLAGQLHDKC